MKLKLRVKFPSINHLAPILPWAILLGLITTAFILIFSPIFHLQYINCYQGPTQPCSQKIYGYLQSYYGTSLLSLSPSQIRLYLKQLDPQIDQVAVKLNFPHTLTVNLSQTPLIAQIQTATNSGILLVNQNNFTSLSQQPSSKLPLIISPYTHLNSGESVTHQELLFAINLVRILQNNAISFTSLTVNSPTQIIADLKSGRAAVFSSQSDLSRQVTSLQLILSESTINPALPVIDVRFKKPVLKPSI
jgi:cell division septal protein FtsQ